MGQTYTLQRTKKNTVVEDIQANPDEAEASIKDSIKDTVEDALDVFQEAFLYGTWSDSTGVVSITFNKDGTVFVGGLENTLGASLFTFTEVDNDTIQLSAKTDNILLGMVKLNLNYEISGDTMEVEIAGKSYQLKKDK